MPFTPQQYPNNTLQVDYVAVGDDKTPWRDEVLVPGPPPASPRTDFVVPTEAHVRNRAGRGSMGALRSTLALDAAGPRVKWGHFEIPIPLAAKPDPALTGGLTREQAAGRVGAMNEEEGYLGYYLPGMKTWFFIRGDGRTRVLRPEGDDWSFDFAKNMPAFVPDLFGRGDEKTAILLNPDVFGEIVEVQTPWRQMYYNPGLTYLDANELRSVLDHAERKLGAELDAVVINPNGLAKQWVLTLGVKVDSAGKWIHPVVPVREVPLAPR
jgi:hypothetical protein